jgi:pimeloyl-ACP methyl ester carboxylesterase
MKKIISVILATAMLAASLSVVGFAYETKTAVYPEVQVHGFSYQELYLDKDDTSSDVIWPPTTDTIFTAVKDSIPYLAKFAVTRDWDTLGTQLAPIVRKIFEPAFLDENGNPQGNTGVYFEYPTKEEVKENPEQMFEYDWRLDPIETAAQLNDFIDYILDCTGAKKVNLQCHSFGGVVTTAYIKLYGTSKLNTVVYNTTAIYGETFTGELMTGKISLDGEAIHAYMEYVFDGKTGETIMNGIFDILSKAGLLDLVCSLGNTFIEKLSPTILGEAIVPLFGGWLSIWSMVPDEYIDDAMDYVFNTVYKDSTVDRTQLINKINNYNTLVRANREDILDEAAENTNFYVICRYGYSAIPATESWKNLSDGTIDSKFTSFGATTSDYNSTLTDEQLSDSDPERVSPDKRIDATTCRYPDRTWFIRGLKHADAEGTMDELFDKFFEYDGQATVDTFEDLPQFLSFDSTSLTISADTGEQTQKATGIIAVFKEIIDMFKSLLYRIFGRLVPAAPVC